MNRINNYRELKAEQARLEKSISDQTQILKDHVARVEETFSPVVHVVSVLGAFRDKNSNKGLLSTSVALGIDWLIGHKLLSRANWLIRLLVPGLLKTVSAKAIKKI